MLRAAKSPAAGGRLHYLDFLPDLVTGPMDGSKDGFALRKEFELDGTHLSPEYAKHLANSLASIP